MYYAIKFFPFWGAIVAVSCIPMTVKLFKRKSVFSGFMMLFLILGLVYLTYIYIAYDGFNNAVPFIMKWSE